MMFIERVGCDMNVEVLHRIAVNTFGKSSAKKLGYFNKNVEHVSLN